MLYYSVTKTASLQKNYCNCIRKHQARKVSFYSWLFVRVVPTAVAVILVDVFLITIPLGRIPKTELVRLSSHLWITWALLINNLIERMRALDNISGSPFLMFLELR